METKEMLNEEVTETAKSVCFDPLKTATTLSRTLGRKLAQMGWNVGSRGSGIVAMTDSDLTTTRALEAEQVINNWLNAVHVNDRMKKGKLADTKTVKYREGAISVVDTGTVVKVIVS